ncbi:pyrimidine 5-nucleotidase [Sporormia fimetaria CBS 119925]|uniref:Pyrimidine 5-nucleotidase n=1 Tax=Sporormia fimetaria CBS 119925 TaxID=1340428 RepID=A0A6A6VCD6_9PLEO|nr:pyrimidine 5-nucleotidase [Sporormia fimetaria CBS 119925]
MADQKQGQDERPVFFFDIDNCLYPKSTNIQHMMSDLIHKFFQTHLSLSSSDANHLHLHYYRTYGLAIEGLVRHHKVNALEYNAKVDDALPLEDVIRPDPILRALLLDLDTSKVRPWLFTNAYVNHGKRVVKLLGVEDLFEGITYCDYASERFVCKPHREMFEKAMREAGVEECDRCYFVDDSALNVNAAWKLGWHSVHLLDKDDPAPEHPACEHDIRSLEQLRDIFPQFFKSRQEKREEEEKTR